MPELPEVETIRSQLEKEIAGYYVGDVWTDTPKQLRPSPDELRNGVVGRKIVRVGRRAKLLLFELRGLADDETECYVAVHLRLTGRLLVRKPDDAPDEYVHVVLGLEKRSEKWEARSEVHEAGNLDVLIKEKKDTHSSLAHISKNQNISSQQSETSHLSHLTSNLELRFSDARKFGYFQLIHAESELQEVLAGYGPEPLNDLTLAKFQRILKSTSRKIKDVLMDQARISGIGNIYANDALWLAKIHPERPASSLTPLASQDLFNAIEQVLGEGLKTGGASDQWYRQIHGEKGEYQEHFKVYGRTGEPCLRHPNTKIKYLKVSQRGTFYCPRCQKL